ncbi:flavin reductase family protein [Croceibacterium sp. LX-88]|uniref:Flavin reductase family protein n=1 Tax=Croceibacterium selenioxidans TaxID=2838833 RepID=A0ABS5W4H8_9SPHN|nr:flavin reductase family protein [Croceibacterium selenioxidans]MBT2134665.1 flavin reductase family protein [Croceibacterium selenioxidans]
MEGRFRSMSNEPVGDVAAKSSGRSEPAKVAELRQALRRLGGGVTIVATIDDDGRPCGLMMTSVMSLSFDPPSMLLAINRSASALPSLIERGRFSINLIGVGDEEMCSAFAASDKGSRFASASWKVNGAGVPVYQDAIATLVCEIDDAQTFGTHVIIRGLVLTASCSEKTEGLVYLNGQFCRAQPRG